jgi:hypothetical protein
VVRSEGFTPYGLVLLAHYTEAIMHNLDPDYVSRRAELRAKARAKEGEETAA